MDYERLINVYADEFWKKYRKYYRNQKERIEYEYLTNSDWAKTDEKERNVEAKQKQAEILE